MKAAIFLLITTLFSTSLFSQHFSWAQSWGADSYDRGSAIATDLDGNVYTTGVFSGTVDFDASQAVVEFTAVEQSIFIKKTDRHGKLIWARQLGGTNSASSSDIDVSSAGEVYITGSFLGSVDFDPGPATFFLNAMTGGRSFTCKLDEDGDFVWAKQFGGTAYTRTLTLDNDNNVYSAGNFSGASDFDPGTGEAILTGGIVSMFVTKLDEDGNYVWAKHFNNNSADTVLTAVYDIAVDDAGNVYTTGGFGDAVDFDPGTGVHQLVPQSMDAFICKLNANGNLVWVKQLGSEFYDRGISLALDEDANIYTVGSFAGVVDFDPGAGVSTMTSGMYTDGPTSFHTANLYLSKFDSDGHFIWTKGMLGSGDMIGCKVALNSDGDIITGGYFLRTIDIDPGAGQQLITSTGPLDYREDIFAAKLDNTGNLLWAKTFGGESNDKMHDLSVDPDGNLYLMGDFDGTVDFNPGTAAWNLSETDPVPQTYDVFLAKYSDCTPTQSSETVTAPCNEDYTWAVNGEIYPASGIYHYVLANSAGCDSIITLDLDIPVMEVEYENIDGTLTYTNPQPGDVYQWVNCSSNSNVEGATASTFTPMQTASYVLIVTNGTCTDSSTCIPFTFVGLDEINTANIRLYPNPVQDQFTVSVDSDNQLLSVEVTAINGQLVHSVPNPGNTFSVNGWQTGIYLVKVTTEKGSHTFRLIKD